MKDPSLCMRVLVVALLALAASGCAEQSPTSASPRSEASDTETSLSVMLGELDARLAERRQQWFATSGPSIEELEQTRRQLSAALQRVRSGMQAGLGGAAEVSPEEGVPPSLTGFNNPSIKNQNVAVVTQIKNGIAASTSYLRLSGAWSGTKGAAAIGSSISAGPASIDPWYKDVAMSIAYNAAMDTVRVSTDVTHSGNWSTGSGETNNGSYTSVRSFGTDNSVPPTPPPPPPDDDGTCDGNATYCSDGTGSPGGGSNEAQEVSYEIWCWFVSYDGGQTWLNTGVCWAIPMS